MIVPPSLSSGGLVRCNASRTAHVAGDAAGGCCFLPCLKSFCIRSLGCAAGRTEPAHRAQTPLPAHRHPALAARSNPERRQRRAEPRGGAGGGSGEQAPRAEQSRGWRRQRGAGGGAAGCGSAGPRGWRRWPRCSWVRGAGAGGAGAAGASFRYDVPRFPPCCVQLGFLQRAQFTASFCLDFLPALL